MANGLNQQFINDPERFLSGCKSIDTAKTQHGSSYAIDANGIASLDMTAYSPSQVMVKQADGGFFSETPISAYYLPSQVNQTMFMNLSNGSDFFFTDLITGCQFMAYGYNRHNLRVCHVNALDEGAADYERAAAGIRSHRF